MMKRAIRHRRGRDLHIEFVPAHIWQTENLSQRRLWLQVVILRHASAEDQRRNRLRRTLEQSPM